MSVFETDTLGAMTEVVKLTAAAFEMALENWKADDDYDGTAYQMYIATREAKWKANQMLREELIRREVDEKMAAWRKLNAA